jgi:hypothetical protein
MPCLSRIIGKFCGGLIGPASVRCLILHNSLARQTCLQRIAIGRKTTLNAVAGHAVKVPGRAGSRGGRPGQLPRAPKQGGTRMMEKRMPGEGPRGHKTTVLPRAPESIDPVLVPGSEYKEVADSRRY